MEEEKRRETFRLILLFSTFFGLWLLLLFSFSFDGVCYQKKKTEKKGKKSEETRKRIPVSYHEVKMFSLLSLSLASPCSFSSPLEP